MIGTDILFLFSKKLYKPTCRSHTFLSFLERRDMKMEAKDIMRELPMGFGMALMKNQKAYENFCSFSSQKQDSIIEHTHQIASKKEMQAFVAQIAQNTMV